MASDVSSSVHDGGTDEAGDAGSMGGVAVVSEDGFVDVAPAAAISAPGVWLLVAVPPSRRQVAIVRHATSLELFAIDANCYHAGGPLSGADVEDVPAPLVSRAPPIPLPDDDDDADDADGAAGEGSDGGTADTNIDGTPRLTSLPTTPARAREPCVVCPWHQFYISLRTGERLYSTAPPQPRGVGPPPAGRRGGGGGALSAPVDATPWASAGRKQRVHAVKLDAANERVLVRLDRGDDGGRGDVRDSDRFAFHKPKPTSSRARARPRHRGRPGDARQGSGASTPGGPRSMMPMMPSAGLMAPRSTTTATGTANGGGGGIPPPHMRDDAASRDAESVRAPPPSHDRAAPAATAAAAPRAAQQAQQAAAAAAAVRAQVAAVVAAVAEVRVAESAEAEGAETG